MMAIPERYNALQKNCKLFNAFTFISLKNLNMMPTENQISSFRIFYFAVSWTPLPGVAPLCAPC